MLLMPCRSVPPAWRSATPPPQVRKQAQARLQQQTRLEQRAQQKQQQEEQQQALALERASAHFFRIHTGSPR